MREHRPMGIPQLGQVESVGLQDAASALLCLKQQPLAAGACAAPTPALKLKASRLNAQQQGNSAQSSPTCGGGATTSAAAAVCSPTSSHQSPCAVLLMQQNGSTASAATLGVPGTPTATPLPAASNDSSAGSDRSLHTACGAGTAVSQLSASMTAATVTLLQHLLVQRQQKLQQQQAPTAQASQLQQQQAPTAQASQLLQAALLQCAASMGPSQQQQQPVRAAQQPQPSALGKRGPPPKTDSFKIFKRRRPASGTWSQRQQATAAPAVPTPAVPVGPDTAAVAPMAWQEQSSRPTSPLAVQQPSTPGSPAIAEAARGTAAAQATMHRQLACILQNPAQREKLVALLALRRAQQQAEQQQQQQASLPLARAQATSGATLAQLIQLLAHQRAAAAGASPATA